MTDWDDNLPIYQQLRLLVVRRILAGSLEEGEALPSIRQVAADMRVNPLTVSKAYQLLVDEALIHKQRGLGMYVSSGARQRALAAERERFLQDEWPPLRERIAELGLDLDDLMVGDDS
ncbi:MAG: GntR family transcriptional regulator [Pseudomonadota bacterium]